MECKARLKRITRTFDRKYIFTLECDDVTAAQLESLDDKDMRMTLVRWRDKRTLNANNFCWHLISQIALKEGTTPQEVYEFFIQNYAPVAQDMNGRIVITVKRDVDMDRISGHWKRLQTSSDGKWVSYAMLQGSSEFDTATMADFIEVIKDEAERLGIETATRDEIERMKTTWRGS